MLYRINNNNQHIVQHTTSFPNIKVIIIKGKKNQKKKEKREKKKKKKEERKGKNGKRERK